MVLIEDISAFHLGYAHGFREPGEIEIDVGNDSGSSDAECRAVGAHIDGGFFERTFAFDPHAFCHADGFATPVVCASQEKYFIAVRSHFDGLANRARVEGGIFVHFSFSSRFGHVPVFFTVPFGVYGIFVFVGDVEFGVCRSFFA